MSSRVENAPLGQRLIPQLIDERAAREPSKVFSSIPKATNLAEGYEDVTYRTLSRAVNHVAWWLYHATSKAAPGCAFAWVGPNDLRYPIFIAAAMKCRYKILVPSLHNTAEDQKRLFLEANCDHAFCDSAKLSMVQEKLGNAVTTCAAGPDLEELLESDDAPRFVHEVDYEDVKDEICLVLHTSGSTGPPKAINFSIAAAHATDLHMGLDDPQERLWWRMFPGKRFYMGFPCFHAAGLLSCVLMPIFFDYITVYGPAGPPDANMLESIHKTAYVSGGFYPPFALEKIANSASAPETMKTIDIAIFGGGTLIENTGRKLSELTHLHNVFGHTEGLVPPHFVTDAEDWQYFHWHPATGCEPEHTVDDLYKMVLKKSTEHADVQPVFRTFPDEDQYATGDLLSKHPSQPGLWLHRGRTDDLVVLSTGETFNPWPAEGMINSSPLVDACILAGEERAQTTLVIQSHAEMTAGLTEGEIIEQLWALVEDANAALATEAKIAKEHVVILQPGTTFLYSSKGAIQRKVSLAKVGTTLYGSA